jgi:uncharacterized protein
MRRDVPGMPEAHALDATGSTGAERTALLDLARAAVRAAAFGAPPPDLPADLPPRLCDPAGAFVSLHDAAGELRGCIGSVELDGPLGDLVVRMAVAAATRDPRFAPVGPDELDGLRVEISVLSPMRPVMPDDIDPAVHGVCIRLGRRHAVLLPQVAAERGWDRETLLAHLCEKASLPATAWRTPAAALFAFTIVAVEGPI